MKSWSEYPYEAINLSRLFDNPPVLKSPLQGIGDRQESDGRRVEEDFLSQFLSLKVINREETVLKKGRNIINVSRIFDDQKERELGAVKPVLLPTTRCEINVFRAVRPILYRAQRLQKKGK